MTLKKATDYMREIKGKVKGYTPYGATVAPVRTALYR